MARERTSVLVRMPPELKHRLAEEVAATGASLNDVAVGLLASRLAVPYVPTGRKGSDPRSSGDVLLRMPPELKDKLARRASERRRNVNDLIVETLSAGLGLKGEEPMASANGNAGLNGHGRQQDKVRVAIIGMGNCANSLLQGLQYYKEAERDTFVPGLMHVDLGGYHISDIEVVAAFDVVQGKVGVDLAEAMWAHPNDTIKFADVAPTCDLMSSPMIGSPACSNRRCQYASRAMKTGMQLTIAQPASRICSAYHFVASSEPTGR